jgi:hypothetical protein
MAISPDPNSVSSGAAPPLSLELPAYLTRPLWKSLPINFRDRFFPERMPPLALTSRPIRVGMLVSDMMGLPWYRTIFTNLGDVINPDSLPPLELESRPVDVGELISDQMSHMWWSSLLRNLADSLAPERLPALQLTAVPVSLGPEAERMQIMRWSALISTPKVFHPDKPTPPPSTLPPRPISVATQPVPNPADPAHAEAVVVRTRLSRSRIRELVWISLAVVEVAYLAGSYFGVI